jgi:hypothetical protein
MDKEWCKKIEAQIDELESRILILEEGHGLNGEAANCLPEVLELDLELPEADIGGLHFNWQKVKGVFDLKEDGWYCCRDILFLSARNTEDDNSRDILSEYLQSGEVKEAFAAVLRNAGIEAGIEVSLPTENGCVKKYNGVDCWYWLKDHYPSSAASFCGVTNNGFTAGTLSAGSVGGCAPAFRVV